MLVGGGLLGGILGALLVVAPKSRDFGEFFLLVGVMTLIGSLIAASMGWILGNRQTVGRGEVVMVGVLGLFGLVLAASPLIFLAWANLTDY